ncbi:hypothetical protein [Microbulbifer sp. ALW1]|uniref:hypothetical protein n=1 Tax=Microbulbifer sp. (strain ALW1) TaxID=1516059 RepID=UPI00135A7082|nr:hypothetical protein [Microbulbifer sp. ALW1]
MSDVLDSLSRGINQLSKRAEQFDREHLDRSGLLVWNSVTSLHGQGGKIDRDSGLKSIAKKSAMAAQKGVSIAQTATGNVGLSGMAIKSAVGVGVGAVSSTGVGLLAAAGGMAVMNSGVSGYSAYKTHHHIKGLEAILANWTSYSCESCGPFSDGPCNREMHGLIGTLVLPEIIRKKKTKRARKATAVLPVIGGMISGLHSGAHSLQKRLTGTRGKQRHYHAELLAVHLITHECQLAEAIVAELFSVDEMEQIKRMNSDRAGPKICSKISSM